MASDSEMVDAPAGSQDKDGAAAAAAAAEQQQYAEAAEKPFVQRIQVLSGETESAASFQFTQEDHTLGNALRHIIMKNPDVEFCGYSIPHPSDPKMNLRIQTYDNVSVYDVLEKGLKDLMDACDVVTEKFTAARDLHVNNGQAS